LNGYGKLIKKSTQPRGVVAHYTIKSAIGPSDSRLKCRVTQHDSVCFSSGFVFMIQYKKFTLKLPAQQIKTETQSAN